MSYLCFVVVFFLISLFILSRPLLFLKLRSTRESVFLLGIHTYFHITHMYITVFISSFTLILYINDKIILFQTQTVQFCLQGSIRPPIMLPVDILCSAENPLLLPTADRPRLLISVFTFRHSVFLSSGRGFCGTVTLVPALSVTGPHQTPPPPLLAPGPPRTAAAAVPDQEHGAYAPSRTFSLRCRSCIRSGAAGTPPVPSPSWWTASV